MIPKRKWNEPENEKYENIERIVSHECFMFRSYKSEFSAAAAATVEKRKERKRNDEPNVYKNCRE